MNYTLEETNIDGELLIRIVSPGGRVWLSGSRMPYPMNSAMTQTIADNKRYSYEIAKQIGMRIPQSVYITRSSGIEPALALLDDYRRIIVKPLDSYRSKGVTLDITSPVELEAALGCAFLESPTAIAQEQVDGEEHRFTVLNGNVVSVLRRERPQVRGDGVRPIRDLVQAENEARRKLQAKTQYPQWTKELLGEIVDSEEVLAMGVPRILSSETLVSRGASTYELLPEIERVYIEMVEDYATTISAGFVAIDMFLTDHTKMVDYWFNECNVSPALKMYLTPRNTDVEHIIDQVVDEVDKLLNNNS